MNASQVIDTRVVARRHTVSGVHASCRRPVADTLVIEITLGARAVIRAPAAHGGVTRIAVVDDRDCRPPAVVSATVPDTLKSNGSSFASLLSKLIVPP